MDEWLKGFVFGAMFATIATIIIFGPALHYGVDRSWRKQIADKGCAEFYIDQNHDKQWRWK